MKVILSPTQKKAIELLKIHHLYRYPGGFWNKANMDGDSFKKNYVRTSTIYALLKRGILKKGYVKGEVVRKDYSEHLLECATINPVYLLP